jgi:hypothetical protein
MPAWPKQSQHRPLLVTNNNRQRDTGVPPLWIASKRAAPPDVKRSNAPSQSARGPARTIPGRSPLLRVPRRHRATASVGRSAHPPERVTRLRHEFQESTPPQRNLVNVQVFTLSAKALDAPQSATRHMEFLSCRSCAPVCPCSRLPVRTVIFVISAAVIFSRLHDANYCATATSIQCTTIPAAKKYSHLS